MIPTAHLVQGLIGQAKSEIASRIILRHFEMSATFRCLLPALYTSVDIFASGGLQARTQSQKALCQFAF